MSFELSFKSSSDQSSDFSAACDHLVIIIELTFCLGTLSYFSHQENHKVFSIECVLIFILHKNFNRDLWCSFNDLSPINLIFLLFFCYSFLLH